MRKAGAEAEPDRATEQERDRDQRARISSTAPE
jgi:hypothetical protein